jgi:long-subunit fatty acid transport protein
MAIFNDVQTLRLGVSSEYVISPMFSIYGGVDYIPTSYAEGQQINSPFASVSDANNDLINAYIGVSAKFNDYLTGTLSYNYTDSTSDIDNQNYTRNRINLGISAEF